VIPSSRDPHSAVGHPGVVVAQTSRYASHHCRLLLIGLTATTLACATTRGTVPVPAQIRLEVVGDVVFPPLNARGKPRVDVGGLSGAYYDAEQNRLYAVADDRQRPRVLAFDVTVTPTVTLMPREIVPLQSPGERLTLDAEGLAPAPDGRWFVSSEGDPAAPVRPVSGIHEYTRQGRFVRTLPLPAPYVGVEGDDSQGMRLNLSLEALSRSPDGRWLVAGEESSLLQDGPVGDFEHGAMVRLLVYDLKRPDLAPREYAYTTDAMRRPATWAAADGDAGVVDVVVLGENDLLVLERGYIVEASTESPRRENTIRIYSVKLEAAAEVTGRQSLLQQPPQAPLNKRLVLDLASIAARLNPRLRGLENFEAITLGPRMPDGSMTLLLMSDDNFSESQVTALIALRFAR
jgi:hypothetical protein